MKAESWGPENRAENPGGAERPFRSASVGISDLKHIVADKLHGVANTIAKKAVSREANPEVAHYAQQASAMLEQSAEYVRNWEYADTEASVRDYIRKNPGTSLIIAGLTGLVIGTLLRRR